MAFEASRLSMVIQRIASSSAGGLRKKLFARLALTRIPLPIGLVR
jgi:hypothetical protein